MIKNTRFFILATLAYVLIVFPVAIIWHLVAFKPIYVEIGYFGSKEPVIALGFITIVVQGILLAYAYPFFYRGGSHVKSGLKFGFWAGAFLWSCQVLAFTAKNQIEHASTYFAMETGYLAIQFILVGLAIGLIYGRCELQ